MNFLSFGACLDNSGLHKEESGPTFGNSLSVQLGRGERKRGPGYLGGLVRLISGDCWKSAVILEDYQGWLTGSHFLATDTVCTSTVFVKITNRYPEVYYLASVVVYVCFSWLPSVNLDDPSRTCGEARLWKAFTCIPSSFSELCARETPVYRLKHQNPSLCFYIRVPIAFKGCSLPGKIFSSS